MYKSRRFIRDKTLLETNNVEWRILSGKYGLLKPQVIIELYDRNLDCSFSLTLAGWFIRITIQIGAATAGRGPRELLVSARGAYERGSNLALRVLGFHRADASVMAGPCNFTVWRRGRR
jgi:hypothetical protein